MLIVIFNTKLGEKMRKRHYLNGHFGNEVNGEGRKAALGCNTLIKNGTKVSNNQIKRKAV